MSYRGFKMSMTLNSRGSNHYQVLGLKTDASEKDIKSAYFKLAKKYHPDLNSGADARDKFEKVSKAYEMLSDSAKKEMYDQQMGFGRSQFNDMHFSNQSAARARSTVYSDDEYESMDKSDKRTKPMSGGGQRRKQQGSQQFWEDVNKESAKEEYAKKHWDEFDDFFEFNSANSQQQSHLKDETKGADYKADVTIEFMDSFKGVKTFVEMNKRMICHSCKGTRAKQGS